MQLFNFEFLHINYLRQDILSLILSISAIEKGLGKIPRPFFITYYYLTTILTILLGITITLTIFLPSMNF